MEIYNLVIEVTRRCNMECEHCLRGEAENVDMDIKHVENLFQKIDYISTLTLSGGEPTLAYKIIDKILETAKNHSVEIGSFYIATNGKHVPDGFLLSLIKLHIYCDDNEISCVNWSNDEYHEGEYPESIEKLEVFSFAQPKYTDNIGRNVIAEGKAEYFGEKYNTREYFEAEKVGDRTVIIDGNVYLNCEGNLIAGCDWSYESQRMEENIICPVSEFNAEKMEQFIKESE